MKILNFVLLVLFMASCHPEKFPGKALSIKNNSPERIYFWYSNNYNIFHYPDTSLPLEIPLYINSADSNSGAGAGANDPDWVEIYSQLPEGKFSIYFFDELATTQEEWDDIRLNHMILRKDITFEELKNNDYIIYYP